MNKRALIKIGLDFHGVVDKYPDYFAKFTQQAVAQGIEIYIITGGPKAVVENYLQEHRIQYTELFAILDYYDAQGQVEYFPNGEFKIPSKLWNTAKGEYCAKHKITLHIDDSTEYGYWFSTPYCVYDSASRQCLAQNGLKIDFSQAPEIALASICQTFAK